MSYLHALKLSQDKSLPEFQRAQYAFSAYVRAPEKVPSPKDIEARRLSVYRELLINNVKGFLDKCFPVLQSLISEDEWMQLTHAFFAEHVCPSPFFNEINEAFVEYLQTAQSLPQVIAPFAAELAHYEWLELATLISPEELPSIASDSLAPWSSIRLSPLATLQAYLFDVHRIGDAYRPKQVPESPSFLVVYRDADDQVQFMSLNPLSFQVLSDVEAQPDITVQKLTEVLAVKLLMQEVALTEHILPMLQQLYQRRVIVT